MAIVAMLEGQKLFSVQEKGAIDLDGILPNIGTILVAIDGKDGELEGKSLFF